MRVLSMLTQDQHKQDNSKMKAINRRISQHDSIWDLPEDARNTPVKEIKPENKKVIISQGSLKLPPRYISRFQELPVPLNLLEAFRRCNLLQPVGIQGFALPYLFNKSDHIIIHAPEKSGKTTAAITTILGKVQYDQKVLKAIVLCPTCESAESIYIQLNRIATNVSVGLALRKNKVKGQTFEHVLVATPGKVLEFVDKCSNLLQNVDLIVLDNTESMMSDQGHRGPIHSIVSKTSKNVQVLALCSAPRSQESASFMEYIFSNSAPIVMEFQGESNTACEIKNLYVLYRDHQDKLSIINTVLRGRRTQCLIICERREHVQSVQEYLCNNGFISGMVSGKMDFSKRKETLDKFKQGSILVLVATPSFMNVSASQLSIVINSDAIKTQDKGLDHEQYRKRAQILNGKANALCLNLLDDRWADCARDENGISLRFYPMDQLKALRKF